MLSVFVTRRRQFKLSLFEKTNFKSEIDQEIKENISKKLNIPKGDNCEGYPVFSRLVVGYDMKKY